MHKGRLLASICAVGLIAAVPALAAETAAPTDTGTDHPAATAKHHGMHHGMHHARGGARSRQSDASQNAAVENLNQQSLQAAREGHDFNTGTTGPAPGAASEGPGAPSGTMGTPGPGAPAAGGGKM